MVQIFWLVALLLSGTISCSRAQSQEYDIDKPSPSGSYRVKVRVKPRRAGKPLDEAHFQFFKGDKLVNSWEWQQQDQLEPGFDSLTPIEWIDDNVLRIGGGQSRPSFFDEVIVRNASGEYLDYVSISYNRFESFDVFDLAPGAKIAIHPRPWFTAKGDQFGFGYSGIAGNGKRFQGIVEAGERTSPSSGPRTFEIVVKPGDLY